MRRASPPAKRSRVRCSPFFRLLKNPLGGSDCRLPNTLGHLTSLRVCSNEFELTLPSKLSYHYRCLISKGHVRLCVSLILKATLHPMMTKPLYILSLEGLMLYCLNVQAAVPPVHEFMLDNGLKLVVQEDHRAPVAVSQVWYKIGSSYEHS